MAVDKIGGIGSSPIRSAGNGPSQTDLKAFADTLAELLGGLVTGQPAQPASGGRPGTTAELQASIPPGARAHNMVDALGGK
jgi:hypothetical protein